jgi:hypothetical protein
MHPIHRSPEAIFREIFELTVVDMDTSGAIRRQSVILSSVFQRWRTVALLRSGPSLSFSTNPPAVGGSYEYILFLGSNKLEPRSV